MKSKIEKTENANEVKIEMTVEAEKFENAIKRVYFKNAKYFNIPGFRKGKAPINIVEKYYGAEVFYEDAFNEVATEAYEEVIKENKLEIVSKPKVDIIQIEKGKDLIFTIKVQTKPKVELGEYKGIEIEKVEYPVTEEDIENKLKELQEKNSRIINIEDRALENGDIAIIDFNGFLEGEEFEGGKAEYYELEIGSNMFIKGFEEQLIGMQIEEEKEIQVTFPEEYFSKDLAGKEVTFKVMLHEINKKELPKLDDEFAKDVSEFETIEELKANIKAKKEEENKEKEKCETEDKAIKTVVENSKLEIPSGMIELEIDKMMEDLENGIESQGFKLEQYLQILGKTEEEIRKGYKETAIEVIKSRLTLEAVQKAEKIEATEEEINEKIKEMSKNYGNPEEKLKEKVELIDFIKRGIELEKTIKFIVDNIKFKE